MLNAGAQLAANVSANAAIWRPPIGDASFNRPVAGQHVAPMPPSAQNLAAQYAGHDVTVRELLAGVRQGPVKEFADNAYAAGNAGVVDPGNRTDGQTLPFIDRIENVSAAENRNAGVSVLPPSFIDESPHRHIPASVETVPASAAALGASSNTRASAACRGLFDNVLKHLENRINSSVQTFSFPPYTLRAIGLMGGRGAESGDVPNSIELIYERRTELDPVVLKIAVTHAKGFRSVSPIRVFDKPATDVGEVLLKELLLFAGAREALFWLTNPLGHNRTKILPAGCAQACKWRTGIAKSLAPRMQGAELGARIAALCSVEVSDPGLHHPAGVPLHGGLAERLQERMRQYLIGRLGSKWWSDVKLIVTGLNGMNAKPPDEETGTYVHLQYALLRSGDVKLLIHKKCPCLDISFRHVFVRSDYHQLKTFYGQLFLYGVVAATKGPQNVPIVRSVTTLRNRIAKSLKPKISGAMLGKAMEAYYPLTALQSAQEIQLRSLNE